MSVNEIFLTSTFSSRRGTLIGVLWAGASLFSSGCALIPSAGPLKSDVSGEYGNDVRASSFKLVDVTERTIAILAQREEISLAETIGEAAAPRPSLGKGDVVSLSLWEAGSQPLFSSALSPTSASAGARAATLPAQVIGSDGAISVPFAGRVRIDGMDVTEAQRAVEKALARKAANAQVLVSLANSVSDTVNVLGEVNASGRIPLSARGERLLDVLASAGGLQAPPYEAWLSLTRDGRTTRVPFQQVLNNPRENILLHPGDTLSVIRKAESYTAFGATGVNALIKFEGERINLVEAVAKAGGLNDARADPRGVYLLRLEPKSIAGKLAAEQETVDLQDETAVVYRLDLTKVQSYFLARQIAMRDGDVLYVANAPATTVQKLLYLVGLITQPVVQGVILDSATQ